MLIIALSLLLVVFGLIIHICNIFKYRRNIIFVNFDYMGDITFCFKNINEWLESIELTEDELRLLLEKCTDKLKLTTFTQKVFSIEDIKKNFEISPMTFNIKKNFILIGKTNENRQIFYNLDSKKIAIVYKSNLYMNFFDIDYYSIIQKDGKNDK